MTVRLPKSATWIIWPVAIAFACTLTFALGWSRGVDNGRALATRELQPEIQANRDTMNVLSDRLIYLTEWATMETLASWYGFEHNGRRTASGAVFDDRELTAASPWLPFGKRVRVTNISNGRSCVVIVNDRGPHPRLGRGIDLSTAAARKLGMLTDGVVRVTIAPAL